MPPLPAPQTIGKELIERLDAVADGRQPMSLLKNIQFQALGLRNSAPQEFLIISGIIAGLEGDGALARAKFQEAIDKYGYDRPTVLNYYMTLVGLGAWSDAAQVLRVGVPHLHGIESLTLAYGLVRSCGFYSLALEIAEKLHQQTQAEVPQSLIEVNKEFPALGISDEDLFDVVSLMREVLFKNGHPRLLTHTRFVNTADAGPAIILEFHLHGTAEELFPLEMKMHRALAESSLKAAVDGRVIAFLCPNQEAALARNVA